MRFTITNITFIILENKPASKASSDGEKATGSATDQFLSGLAIAMMFFSFFLNA